MKLLPLVCTKCGGPLSFNGSLICECPSCKTPHALVNFEGDLSMSVSYLPFVPVTNGKMQKSFKIRLAEKVRSDSDGNFVITDSYYFDREGLVITDGRVCYNRMVGDDNALLIVGITEISSFKSFRKSIYSEPRVTKICSVEVVPVRKDKNNVLAGHRVVIRVFGPEFEKQANLFSKKIQEWFGVIPEVSLQYG